MGAFENHSFTEVLDVLRKHSTFASFRPGPNHGGIPEKGAGIPGPDNYWGDNAGEMVLLTI
jgi:hypothetical protein